MAQLTASERRELADAIIAAASASRRSFLSDVGAFADMTLEELLEYCEGHGIRIDLEAEDAAIRAKLGKALVVRQRNGELSREAEEDFEDRVGRALVASSKSFARQASRQIHQEMLTAADEREWDEQFYVWISVGDESVCATCHSLHGTVFALDQWEQAGMPGDGSTICGEHCRCILQPVAGTRDLTKSRLEELRVNLPPRPD